MKFVTVTGSIRGVPVMIHRSETFMPLGWMEKYRKEIESGKVVVVRRKK